MHPSGTHMVSAHIGFPFLPAVPGIQVHALDATTGAITSSTFFPIAGAARPVDVVFHPSGNLFYVGDLDNGIYAYSFNGGVPTLAAPSPYLLPGSAHFFYDFAMSPENMLFVASAPDGTFLPLTDISRFQIAADGTLTALPLLTVAAYCPKLALDPNGRTLLMTMPLESGIRSFAIAPGTFALTEAVGSPYSVPALAGYGPSAIVVRR